MTSAKFRQRAGTLARGLGALGLRVGDKVAIWLPNRPSWFIAQQACARIGAVVVALNPRYRTHELAYILAQSDSAALLLTDHLGPVDYLETLHDVLPQLVSSAPGELASERFPLLRHVIVDAEEPYPGCHRLSEVMEAGAASDVALAKSVGPDDVFTLLYTSGTTSFPKGAMISHRHGPIAPGGVRGGVKGGGVIVAVYSGGQRLRDLLDRLGLSPPPGLPPPQRSSDLAAAT